jgi:hypothetical protein
MTFEAMPIGTRAAIKEAAELFHNSLYHLRLDRGAKDYHDRAEAMRTALEALLEQMDWATINSAIRDAITNGELTDSIHRWGGFYVVPPGAETFSPTGPGGADYASAVPADLVVPSDSAWQPESLPLDGQE